MAVNFLHGVETIEVNTGTRTIQVVKTAVIGLIGIAPKGDKNKPILVNNDRDAAQFGSQIPGFSIPQSLNAIFAQGAGTVIVVNVFDEASHTATVTAEAKTVTNGKLKLDYAPIGTVTITDATGDPVEYVLGTDYSIDDYGNFTVLSSTITDGTALKFTYKRLDESAIENTDIIGAVDAGTGARTGLKCFDLSYNLFGYNPKILIAPTFSMVNAIAVELTALANKYRAITYLDAPIGTTISEAIAGRGPSGSINFNTSDKRTELLYPNLKYNEPATNTDVVFAYSAFKAGLRAAVDNNEGYWVSDSNHQIQGITGVERDISAIVNDANCDANLLNEAGITTVFNTFGTGVRAWGNRNASFPTNTGADNFVVIRRTADIIHESVELAALQFIDQPVTQGWIDSVRESVNAFIRVLVMRGALLDGVCKYNPDDNPASELAQGHVTFYFDIMPPTPAERITFNSLINIDYLSSLK